MPTLSRHEIRGNNNNVNLLKRGIQVSVPRLCRHTYAYGTLGTLRILSLAEPVPCHSQ